jgi:two-component sensor histidine kinase
MGVPAEPPVPRRNEPSERSAPGAGTDPGGGFRRVEAVVDRQVSLGGLRHFLRQALVLLDLREAEDVVLLTHELVKNALAVDEPDVRVSVARTPLGGVRVEVMDHGYGLPEMDDDRDHGHFGLQIVDRVADRWGVDQFLPGKIVWFELVRTS